MENDLSLITLFRRPEFLDPQAAGDDFGGHAEASTEAVGNETERGFSTGIPFGESGEFQSQIEFGQIEDGHRQGGLRQEALP